MSSLMTDQRIRTIRAVMVSLLLAVLTVVVPEVAIGAWPVVPMLVGCCCTGIECPACTSAGAPDEVEVVIPTIPNGTCTTCNNYSGTYTLPFLQTIDAGAGNGECQYRLFIDKECGLFSPDRILVRIIRRSGPGYITEVSLQGPAGPPTSTIKWLSVEETSAYDCKAISGLVCTPDSAGTVCDIPTDDATVTAL